MMKNTKLTELFNLPEESQIEDEAEVEIDEAPEVDEIDIALQDATSGLPVAQTTLDTLSKVSASLPVVRNLSSSDNELDELKDLAVQAFKDLTDVGMQVEPRHAAEIHAVASTMLGHAISAAVAKNNKKFKIIDLSLKLAESERKQAALESKKSEETSITAEATQLDRNDLMRLIAEMHPSK